MSGLKVKTQVKAGGGQGGQNSGSAGYYISPIDGNCLYYKDSAYNAATRNGYVLVPCTP